MKEYIKRFWVWYALIAVLAVVYLILNIGSGKGAVDYKRTNTECLTDERVFDMADKLSDEEEEDLRALIAKRESQIGVDIVLVTIDDPELDSDEEMMEYADYFCIDNKFGYNKAVGDAVIYVDNWYNGYVWMCTSGKAHERYSSSMIDNVIDRACAVVNANPYKGYERYVNQVWADMSSTLGLGNVLAPGTIFIVALIVTIIYLVANLSGRKGKKTTTAKTYVASTGQPALRNSQDIFLTKHVSKRRIESSSGGGGGGGSHRTGGHSFGGGGGRH